MIVANFSGSFRSLTRAFISVPARTSCNTTLSLMGLRSLAISTSRTLEIARSFSKSIRLRPFTLQSSEQTLKRCLERFCQTAFKIRCRPEGYSQCTVPRLLWFGLYAANTTAATALRNRSTPTAWQPSSLVREDSAVFKLNSKSVHALSGRVTFGFQNNIWSPATKNLFFSHKNFLNVLIVN